ncbi:Positive regulator of purine utilization [Fusarium oxysporum f. sp. cubense race 1]|uniref:Positive regulator of purine utilization n=1 Tax=Fusarium oxysporum f. sp. cubense (strain race 1) TaxID=1229664 RepID=N4U1Y1_FUSC1|nr:Positive regulator of purine utilization [Fusarium oxysporum f. sp. cubense race 1]
MPGARNSNGKRPHQASLPDRSAPRTRMACSRCQRLKRKCNLELPTCSNCRAAGAECVDGKSARADAAPRQYITSLTNRINWLESIVRSNCPDVDLSQESEPVQRSSETIRNTENEPPATQPVTSTSEPTGASAMTHEIGLVSLATNQDPRYIGPSSGYFLARVLLDSASKSDDSVGRANRNAPFPIKLVEALQGPLPLPPRDTAMQLCEAYFSAINLQYPILHQHRFYDYLDMAYGEESQDPAAHFQVFMVLAIGSAVLSARTRARIPAESYCLSALQYLDELNVENSLKGIQCLVLLLIFTIHSPCVRLNVWYLNYHCIAALVDQGLQRNISMGPEYSLFNQEMRARIFWVIYSFDRIIATMMGRPIGLRDEGCELRMPLGLSDERLVSQRQQQITEPSSDMSVAVHLFEAAKLNSEIKYIAQSIIRDTPRYAYPRVTNINDWQNAMLQRLDEWSDKIPGLGDSDMLYLRTTCQLRYHGLRMLLLRPSPAIPKPPKEALVKCHQSARESLQLFDQLYKKNLLVHSWTTFHGLVLSSITLLYCIQSVSEIARSTGVDAFMSDLSISLSILGATGEHWSGAKHSRDILDNLGKSTVRYIREKNRRSEGLRDRSAPQVNEQVIDPTLSADAWESLGQEFNSIQGSSSHMNMDDDMGFMQNQFYEGLLNETFAEYFEPTESTNLDNIVRDLFQGLIPTDSV